MPGNNKRNTGNRYLTGRKNPRVENAQGFINQAIIEVLFATACYDAGRRLGRASGLTRYKRISLHRSGIFVAASARTKPPLPFIEFRMNINLRVIRSPAVG